MEKTAMILVNLFILGGAFETFTGEPIKYDEGLSEDIPAWTKPTEEDIRKILSAACHKNTEGEEAYEMAVSGLEDFKICSLTYIGEDSFNEEMEMAKYMDSPQLLLKEICMNSTHLKECVLNYTLVIHPCFDEDERENTTIIPVFADAFMDTYCTSASGNLALFIARGVPECTKSKQEAVNNCFESTIGRAPVQTKTIRMLTNFLLNNSESCQNIRTLRNCVVTELMTCENPTAAQLIDYIFDQVQRRPCTQNQQYESLQVIENASPNRTPVNCILMIPFLLVLVSTKWL